MRNGSYATKQVYNYIGYETNSKQNSKGKNDYCSPGKKTHQKPVNYSNPCGKNKYHDIANSTSPDADSRQ
jgi:hypothetical protein